MDSPPPIPTQYLFEPYVGLRPYTDSLDDQARFSGRAQDEEIILANFYASPLTIFYGASGVGKSSVLLAGVVPKLRQTPGFACVVFRTWQAENTLPLLKAAILDAVRVAAKTEVEVKPELQLDDFLLECARVLSGRVVLIFDQFEEYFLYHGASAVSEGFDAEFARSVNRSEINASFLLSMREDGLSKLDRFQGRIPKLLNNLLRLEHLDREAAMCAMREPLSAYNRRLPVGESSASIDDDLVEELLEQVKVGRITLEHTGAPNVAVMGASSPDSELRVEAPFLQVVLTRLWEEEKKHGSSHLTLATLKKLGGAPKILRNHLDKTMGRLERRQRRIAVDIFGHLVTPSGSKIAHTIDDLATYSNRPKSRLTPLLDRLADSDVRVLRTIPPPPDDSAGMRYEIFHDILAAAILAWRQRKLFWRRVRRYIRWAVGIGTAVFLVLVVIGLIAFQEEEKTNTALQMAKKEKEKTSKALQMARANLEVVDEMDKAVPFSRAVIREHVYQVSCGGGGKHIVTAGNDGIARVWDTATGKPLFQLRGSDKPVEYVFFSPYANLIATSGYDYVARLWDGATGRFLRELQPHKDLITSIAFSPNKQLVVTASADGTAQVSEIDTGKQYPTLIGHKTYVNSAVFNPDGSKVITASTDGTARIWDVVTGKTVKELKGHSGVLYTALFSPNGVFAVTASLDRTARIWNVTTGKTIATLSGHKDVVIDAAVSPDSSVVATASADGTARIWDASNGKLRAELNGHTGYVRCVAFSLDGKRLITASDDNTARIWNTVTGQAEAVLQGHTRDVTHAEFTADERFVVTSSMDGTVRVWAPSTARSLFTLMHDGEVYSAEWSHNGQYIVTASSDGTAKIWSAQGELVRPLHGHSREVMSAKFSPDDALVVTASRDNTSAVWEVETGNNVTWLPKHTNWVSSASFSPNGGLIVTTSWDRTARLWNGKGECLFTLPHESEVECAAFSPDSKVVVTGCDNGVVKAWNTQTGEPFLDLPGHKEKVIAIDFSPVDSQRLVTASEDGSAFVWRLVQGVKSIPLQMKGESYRRTNARFSPDGTMVVISSQDCTARVCDAITGEEITSPLKHSDVVLSAAFSPDSKLIVTASGDGSARVWEARSGLQLAELREHKGDVNSAEFSPNGKFIVTAGVDHTARVWLVGNW